MFTEIKRKGYDRHGQQFTSGRFLVLFSEYVSPSDEPDEEKRKARSRKLFGVVRFVALHQFGHFMMGEVRLGNQKFTASGTYGGDGIPMELNKLAEQQRAYLTEVPQELADLYWSGKGHNGPGHEATKMREWARSIDKTGRRKP